MQHTQLLQPRRVWLSIPCITQQFQHQLCKLLQLLMGFITMTFLPDIMDRLPAHLQEQLKEEQGSEEGTTPPPFWQQQLWLVDEGVEVAAHLGRVLQPVAQAFECDYFTLTHELRMRWARRRLPPPRSTALGPRHH